jgi:hypothetical protein
VAGGLPRLELRTASRDVIDVHDGLLQGACHGEKKFVSQTDPSWFEIKGREKGGG